MGSNATLDNLFSAGGTIEATIYLESYPEAAANEPHMCGKTGFVLAATNRDIRTYKQALLFVSDFAGMDGNWQTDTNTILTENWYTVAVTYNESSNTNDPIIYINGVAVTIHETSTPSFTHVDDSAQSGFIGGNASANRLWAGIIDESRWSRTVRTPAWIKATHYFINSNLITAGNVEQEITLTLSVDGVVKDSAVW